MTADFTEETATAAVVESFAQAPSERLREILSAFARHLHAFVSEIEPTQAEWQQGLEFLTRTGQACTPTRQEFVLLSDVLGVSMLVDAINHREAADATASTVLGPFHMVESPERELGADIALAKYDEQQRCAIAGQVRSLDGRPLPGARVDVWQADDAGHYDVQIPDHVPERNLRGLFTTDAEGRFWFRTIVPRWYPIPHDGPVGDLLRASARHPNRPAHVHFIVTADDHEPVTTHIFIAGSPYLDSDAVFGVKRELIRDLSVIDDQPRADRLGLANPFQLLRFDVTLAPIPT